MKEVCLLKYHNKSIYLIGEFDMKKYGFRKLKNGWRFKIGGTSGEAFEITLRYFNK